VSGVPSGSAIENDIVTGFPGTTGLAGWKSASSNVLATPTVGSPEGAESEPHPPAARAAATTTMAACRCPSLRTAGKNSRVLALKAAVPLALLVAASCGGGTAQTDPSIVPTPIGKGDAYRPPAKAPRPELCRPGPVQGAFRAHLELFANRQAIVIPAGIGIGPPAEKRLGRIVDAPCRAATRTLDPTGVVDFDQSRLTVGGLFRIWRERLGPAQLLSFEGTVRGYVAGEPVPGDPRAIELSDGAQIVLESGGFVPPHRSFTFPPRAE
jgi:hypothetical protein